ncbi:saccharopine dehydrogenase family protein [Cohnella sp. GCM10012308]|uniref:saccharopine dehydrogenase family protein n=1 Tax=Cohnella sp. GCM10012308 TaxID=3317329 RepID=UPI003622FDBF
MKNYIVIIGGYGHVGQTICRELGELYPGKVYAAGRSLARAEAFAHSTGGRVRPLQVELSKGFDPGFASRIKLVVMCLDQTDTAFVRYCLENNIRYVDVSANGSFLTQAEGLHAVAGANRATAVLSVGLAPGLTNLLSLSAKNTMDKLDQLDISIMLGLGDRHGKAAIEWTIDNLVTRYRVTKEGEAVEVASLTDPVTTSFGDRLGRRKAYRFNFSDQHVLPRTLGVPTVSTRLCFDSAAATGLLAWSRRMGLFRVLRVPFARNTAVRLFGAMRFGQDLYAVKVDARGKKDGQQALAEYVLQGNEEARITAKVAAAVAERVYTAELPHGVYHIEQLFQMNDILPLIEQDVAFEARIHGSV